MGAAATPADPWPDGMAVEAEPEWTELFNRREGWTGADGIYSAPLDGCEQPLADRSKDTLFWFSDTFVGRVLDDDTRTGMIEGGHANMINNSRAWLRPDGSIDFNTTPIVPNTPESTSADYYWLGDGVVIEGKLHVFAGRMWNDPSITEGWNFKQVGLSLLTWAASEDFFSEPSQVELQTSDASCFFGRGILSNTKGAGAPHPDGFVYNYAIRGTKEGGKLLLGSRVLPQHLADFKEWRFWDGNSWAESAETAVTLTDEVSDEMSVTPLRNGKFALIFQFNTMGAWTCMKIGDSPIGTWSQRLELWESKPEYPVSVLTYNAKAHLHLSKPGTLLVSVNYNAAEFWDHFKYAGTYRPRFFSISWKEFC